MESDRCRRRGSTRQDLKDKGTSRLGSSLTELTQNSIERWKVLKGQVQPFSSLTRVQSQISHNGLHIK